MSNETKQDVCGDSTQGDPKSGKCKRKSFLKQSKENNNKKKTFA